MTEQEVFEPHFVVLVPSRDVYARFHYLIVAYRVSCEAESRPVGSVFPVIDFIHRSLEHVGHRRTVRTHSLSVVFPPLLCRLRYNFVGKMKLDHIDLIAKAARAFADGSGLRDGASVVTKTVIHALSADVAFIVRQRADDGVADLVAAEGVGVADFRRLESRIAKSSLWRMFELSKPLAIDDVGTDRALDFLAFGTQTRFLVAVPVSVKGKTVGMVAAGFRGGSRVEENRVVRVLGAFASVIAQAMLVERMMDAANRKLAEENLHLKQELRQKYDLSQLIGNSGAMRAALDQVTQIARSNSTVLLRGEHGTGKELIAGAIHYNSLRSKRSFVKLNCSDVPDALIENEIFGSDKKGRFELADGGTLYFDEVGGLPLHLQSKVLRAVQERKFVRTDSGEEFPVNVRLIASSSQDLADAVRVGTFDGELLDQLGGFTIYLPPLRERKSDILLLAEHFLEKYEREHKKNVKRISTPAIDMLTAYHYPGNVRELENVIERSVLVCDSNVIHGHHLPPTLQTAEVSGTETRVTLASAVEAFERDLIIDTLKSTRGNVAKAAIMLDSTERILGYKIVKYEIDRKRFRR